MSDNPKSPISQEEQDRRRVAIEKARWSARMEGLGISSEEFLALDEDFIVGNITREERRQHIAKLVNIEIDRNGK